MYEFYFHTGGGTSIILHLRQASSFMSVARCLPGEWVAMLARVCTAHTPHNVCVIHSVYVIVVSYFEYLIRYRTRWYGVFYYIHAYIATHNIHTAIRCTYIQTNIGSNRYKLIYTYRLRTNNTYIYTLHTWICIIH